MGPVFGSRLAGPAAANAGSAISQVPAGTAVNPIVHLSAVSSSGGELASHSLFTGNPSLAFASALDDSTASSVAPASVDQHPLSPSMWAGASDAPEASLSHSFSLMVEDGVQFGEGPDGAERARTDADGAVVVDEHAAAEDSPAPLLETVPSISANSMPRTREEWNARIESLCEKLSVRPLTFAMIEDVQRQVKILTDGRKALKARRNPMRKGDMVIAISDGEESHGQRRGIIGTDNGDGSYMVNWLSPVQETVRVEAHELKPASRYQGAPGSQAHHRVNEYLVRRAIPEKNASMVDELLREGADADHPDETGTPPLLLAILKRCPHQIVASLLKHGADPDLAGPSLQTPLKAAMMNNDFQVVNALLMNGCDCSNVDDDVLGACTPRIAQAIRQYAATALTDEARVALQHEGMAKLMPLVVAGCALDSDIRSQQSALNLLTYLMEQLPAPLLQQLFHVCDPSLPAGQSQQATDAVFNIMLQFTQGEGCDALDAIYGLLRIVQCIIDKAPQACVCECE
jgi:hypothetical protein